MPASNCTATVNLSTKINGTELKDTLVTDIRCTLPEILTIKAAKECPDGWICNCDESMFGGYSANQIRFLAIKSSAYYDEEEQKKCDETTKKKQWCVWYKIYIEGSSKPVCCNGEEKIPLLGPHYHVGELLKCLIGDKKITKIVFCNGLCKEITIEILAGLVCHLPKCDRVCKEEKPQDEDDECRDSDARQYETAS